MVRNAVSRRLLAVLFVSLLSALLGGCGPSRDYARVAMNWEVDHHFKSGRLQPEYRYYFNGPTAEPIALLALKKQYQLNSEFWHEITVSAQLQSWVKSFSENFGEVDDIENVTINYRGLELLDENGQRIGMLYTRYHWVVAWWGEGNEIIVTPPEPSGGQRGIWSMRRRWRSD